ncbi:cytochrome C oxidase assembly protein [Mesobacterium sp. TK19101]|uniref:Cytochrome C oxidase assembly protein n=1 Tax=Mesobacterium hydrothermale TaxID=3111907 RepID=A0ABU6HHT9_9RHOB|nr:cytochrome C oxidase assembly protein [Mesobacterium sp. TK19101]MEC3862023.1 cytochrome C oxidase assembly protein [Mesobacterium sp. TK19101]
MISHQHEIHRRRHGRNVGVALLLASFIVLVLGLTVVKVTRGGFERIGTTQEQSQ